MPKKITVTVDEDGKVTQDFQGFTGKSCVVEADKLREILATQYGITVEETNFFPKPELEIEITQSQQTPTTITQEGKA